MDPTTTWKVLYCVKAPTKYMAVCPMTQAPVVEPEPSPDGGVDAERIPVARFRVNFAQVATAEDIGNPDPSAVWVRFGMRYDGGSYVSSDMQPIPTLVVTQGSSTLTQETTSDGRSKAKIAADEKYHEDLVEEFPWLAHLDIKEAFGTTGESAAKKLRAGSSSDGDPDPVPDEAVWDAVEQMERARATLGLEAPVVDMEFTCHLRGGTAHLLATGSAPDAIQASSKGDAGRAF